MISINFKGNYLYFINFKDEFKLFPTTFNGHKIIKKG